MPDIPSPNFFAILIAHFEIVIHMLPAMMKPENVLPSHKTYNHQAEYFFYHRHNTYNLPSLNIAILYYKLCRK